MPSTTNRNTKIKTDTKTKIRHNRNRPTLTRKDYETILDYYKIKHNNNTNDVKQKAENILSNKLCRCIKKVSRRNKRNGSAKKRQTEKRSIAICKVSVLHNKGLTDSGFSCRKTRKIALRKKHT